MTEMRDEIEAFRDDLRIILIIGFVFAALIGAGARQATTVPTTTTAAVPSVICVGLCVNEAGGR